MLFFLRSLPPIWAYAIKTYKMLPWSKNREQERTRKRKTKEKREKERERARERKRE